MTGARMKGHKGKDAAAELGAAGGSAGTSAQAEARRRNAAIATQSRLEALTPEERSEQASRAAAAAHQRRTPEERSQAARDRWQKRKGG